LMWDRRERGICCSIECAMGRRLMMMRRLIVSRRFRTTKVSYGTPLKHLTCEWMMYLS
jgi:hypothetical protein